MIIEFNKHFKNEDYEIFFNTKTGFELLHGINGKPDPFILELPSLLDIGIMGTCKNKCSFCYQGPEEEPNMKLEDFKYIVDCVKYHVNQIALGGRGDPNHHENFKEIVEYCRENNIVPNYTTSGIELTDKQIEISKMCGAVAISDYDKDHTYNALNKLMENDIKTNIHFLYSFVSHEKAIKILKGIDVWEGKVNLDKLNAIIFLLFKPQGSGRNLESYKPIKRDIQEFSTHIFNGHTSFKVGMDSCLVNHVSIYQKIEGINKLALDTCEAARMSAYISPSLRFIPCSFADPKQGDVFIYDEPIKEMWNNSDRFQQFRRVLSKYPNKCPLDL